jgi:hypothetical protein
LPFGSSKVARPWPGRSPCELNGLAQHRLSLSGPLRLSEGKACSQRDDQQPDHTFFIFSFLLFSVVRFGLFLYSFPHPPHRASRLHPLA